MNLWNAVASQQAFVMSLFVASILVQVLLGVRILADAEMHGELSRTYRLAAIALAAVFGLMLASGLGAFLLDLPNSKLAVVLVVCGASGAGVFGYAMMHRRMVETDEMRTVIARDL
ncbi:MAG: hypothetical protein ABSC92_05560 [Rhizomicrobium sp.]|jgi:hypothetical protein